MISDRIGKYRILSELNRNVWETLYSARDEAGDQGVTIRVLGKDLPWDPGIREQLRNECRSAASLGHPNILALHGFGEQEGMWYVVSECHDGRSLAAVIAEGTPLPVEKKISIIVQAAEALAHAGAQGITHQSIAPCRIHLLPDGVVKVSDFGTGRFELSLGMEARFRDYLSPEQIQGRPATASSDLFSLGLVFYELLTLHHPFRQPDPAKTRENILQQTSIPTIDRFVDLPLGLWPILERCLAKSPEERYPSVADFLDACRQLQRDLADDRQLMLVELHTVLPRLTEAAQRPGVSATLKELQQAVERILASDQVTEYVPLNRMVSALAEHYRTIHAAFDLPVRTMERVAAAAAPRPEGSTAAAVSAAPGEILGRPGPPPAAEWVATEEAPSGASGGPAASALPAAAAAPAAADMVLPAPEPNRPDDIEEIADLLRQIERGRETGHTPTEDQVPSDVAPGLDTPRQATAVAAALPEHSSAVQEPQRAEGAVPDDSRNAMDWFSAPGSPVADGMDSEAGEEVPVDDAQTAGHMRRGIFSLRRHMRRAGLITLASAALLVVIVGVYWAGAQFKPRRGLFVMISDTQDSIARRLFGSGEPAFRKLTAGAGIPGGVLAGSAEDEAGRIADVLVEQARTLRELGREADSKVFLQRALELKPEYEAALAELEALSVPAAAQDSAVNQDEAVQRSLGNAAAFIAAGRMRQARSELDRVERLRPGLDETRRLREKWDQKNAELTLEQERRQAEQSESARRQELRSQRARRAEELHARGNYGEAQPLLEAWLSESPGDPQAQRLSGSATEALRALNLYGSAMNSRKYADALEALALLERANPSDPNLVELRRRTDAGRAAATATVSIYRLREPATILLDGQTIGAEGEAVNQTVGIGYHQITVKTERGGQVAQSHDFAEGQNVHLVYDATLPILRVMMDSDRALIAERSLKEEVHRIPVEHVHGMLRGSCRGELLISYYTVEYKPLTGDHGLSVPFRNLRLMVADRNLRLLYAAGNRELVAFRAADAEAAGTVAEIWGKLKSLEK